jgi:hypothetical protein
MKKPRPRTTATKLGRGLAHALLALWLLLAGASAWAAQVAGVVVHLSGPLLDRKADGTVKVLAVKSEVESGDTLVTEKNTYALVRFVDKGEMTLQPNSTLKVEHFAYEDGKPENDSAAFSLVKGGLRSVTGLLGKRNKEKFQLKTPNATIGIRGTTFIAQYVEPSLPGSAPAPGGIAVPPGLHVTVLDGAIVVTNAGGSLGFQAGQFGYVPGVNQAPVIVPPNQHIQFQPPPSFGAAGSGPGNSAGTGTGEGGTVLAGNVKDANAVDCIVR